MAGADEPFQRVLERAAVSVQNGAGGARPWRPRSGAACDDFVQHRAALLERGEDMRQAEKTSNPGAHTTPQLVEQWPSRPCGLRVSTLPENRAQNSNFLHSNNAQLRGLVKGRP